MSKDKVEEVELEDITQDDIIIAVMGPTGAGKSTFIDVATGQDGRTAGHTLQSCTADIRSVRAPHPKDGRPIVFVDTPGFDDTNRSSMDILAMISDWLEKTYKSSILLTGIIYFHRITDNRMAGSPYKYIRVFGNLCGDNAIQNVILATTMWSRVAADVGSQRESELVGTFWKPMLDNGSSMARFDGSFDSAWSIVETFVEKARIKALLLQEEVVDLGRRLSETSAGITLYNTLRLLISDQKDVIRRLREEGEGQNNTQLVQELNARCEQIQDDLRRTFDQLDKMKIPLGRRFSLFFSFKKTRARALTINDTIITTSDGRLRSVASTVFSLPALLHTSRGGRFPSRPSGPEDSRRLTAPFRKPSTSTTGDEADIQPQQPNINLSHRGYVKSLSLLKRKTDVKQRDVEKVADMGEAVPQTEKTNLPSIRSSSSSQQYISEETTSPKGRSSSSDFQAAADVADLTGQIVVVEEGEDCGGFADVHRGCWTNDRGESPVAIKVLRIRRPVRDGSARFIERLGREIRVWDHLYHPNIVTILGVSYHMNGRPAMIMHWHQNGNATVYLSKREVSTEKKMMLIQDIASGLTYLHTRNPPVVHGDLKGNNILITDDGHAALSDFGLSQIIEETVGPTGLTTTTVAGSTRWQAPEILRGDVDDRGKQMLTTASDVWSFACTVYELLTRRLPYYQCKPYTVGQSILGGVKPQWEENGSSLCEVPIQLQLILDRCWTLDASERPSMRNILPQLETLCC